MILLIISVCFLINCYDCRVDFEKKSTNVEYLFPKVIFEFKYDFDGHVLSEYIKGKGSGKSCFG